MRPCASTPNPTRLIDTMAQMSRNVKKRGQTVSIDSSSSRRSSRVARGRTALSFEKSVEERRVPACGAAAAGVEVMLVVVVAARWEGEDATNARVLCELLAVYLRSRFSDESCDLGQWPVAH